MNDKSTKSPALDSVAATGPRTKGFASESPQWANGLKQIYDSVLEEPLPDSFKDLLSKLDDGEGE